MSVNANDVLAEIRRIAARELSFEGPIEPTSALQRDLRMDSVAMITVAVALEDRFRVQLNEADAGELATVADLVALVCRRVAEQRESEDAS